MRLTIRNKIALLLIILFPMIACLSSGPGGGNDSSTSSGSSGSSGSTTRGTTGGTETGSSEGSNDDNDDSDVDSSGGGTTGGSGNTITVSGQFSKLSVLNLDTPELLVDKEVATSGTITDVMAVNPATGGTGCRTNSVESSGHFEISLTKGKPWFFYFFNRNARGRSMFLGRFYSRTLDTLVPTSTSNDLDLENIGIDPTNGTATSSKDHSDLLSGLGLDADRAEQFGEQDDLTRRYSNPDIDADGEIACGNSNKHFMLDFHIRYDMKKNNQTVSVTDLVDQSLDSSSTTATYTGTGVYVAYPSSFSNLDTGSVTFVDSDVTTSEGGSIPANTPTSAVTTNNFGNHKGFGPNLTSSSELPDGEIQYKIGGETLTFTDVQTPSLTEITAPTGRIFPFLKLIKKSASCTESCTLSGIGYQWMKKQSNGWVEATQTDLDFLVASGGGYFGFRVGSEDNANKMVSFTIPATSLSGTIDWSSTNASLSGVTASELLDITVNQICHVGLSHDDKLGMRYFQGIQNAEGGCSVQ
ncbi:MAG: hypothetical protein HYW02_05475 [Deltaproteobacteria bacterium]|nr:hypothetical protein [Deltaproteobacteria bacterium]